MLQINHEANVDRMFNQNLFYITQFNFKSIRRINFYSYITKELAYDENDFRVAIFKVKPSSKPISERLRQSKYIRAKSIMEIADEIIYEALKNEAA